MRGALTFFTCLSSIYFSAAAAARDVKSHQAAETINLHTISLEKSFQTASQQVQNQLLNAPEASYIYLNHWIDIYNHSKPDAQKFSLPKQARRSKNKIRNYSTPEKSTDWRPNGFPIVSPDWRYSTPVSFTAPSRFRPAPPPEVKSAEFQKDAKDVLIYGDLHSLVRTPEESLTSAFWANGPGTETPPGRWNVIALESSQNMPRAKRIDLMLRLNIALYDAGIAAFDAKYHYDYWRPQTALNTLDPENVDWEPMMQPPFHPEYVSGHSAFSGAAATILEHYIIDKAFCIAAPELLDLEQCYASFNDAAAEAGRSRIFGGIHFEFSNQTGLKLGHDVAQHVISTVNLSG